MRKISEIYHEVLDQINNKHVVHRKLIDDVELRKLIIDNIRELEKWNLSTVDEIPEYLMGLTDGGFLEYTDERFENIITYLMDIFEITQEEIDDAKDTERF